MRYQPGYNANLSGFQWCSLPALGYARSSISLLSHQPRIYRVLPSEEKSQQHACRGPSEPMTTRGVASAFRSLNPRRLDDLVNLTLAESVRAIALRLLSDDAQYLPSGVTSLT